MSRHSICYDSIMNAKIARRRRVIAVFITAIIIASGAIYNNFRAQTPPPDNNSTVPKSNIKTATSLAIKALGQLAIKGRAPMTGYTRQQFGGVWAGEGSCNNRDKVLTRDMTHVAYKPNTCEVESGILNDPYTGKTIHFERGVDTSNAVQIDHVVAIGDAWQTGAQQISKASREQMYNDPLELLAVDGPTNEQKGDGDAATWLPPNKSYRCRYVARQIAVKIKYHLWVTPAEHDAMARILNSCPGQPLPVTESIK